MSQRPILVLRSCPSKAGRGLQPQNRVGGRAGWWGGDLEPEEWLQPEAQQMDSAWHCWTHSQGNWPRSPGTWGNQVGRRRSSGDEVQPDEQKG